MPTFDSVSVGDTLPPVIFGPITRTTLALFAGASGDHNPIHIDIDFAKRAGMDDVFAHGMLSMAVLGRVLTAWVPQNKLRSYGVRFSAITHLHNTIECSGEIAEKFIEDEEHLVRVALTAQTENGVTLSGHAVISLD